MPNQSHIHFLSGKLNLHCYQEHVLGLLDYSLEQFVPNEHSEVVCCMEYKDKDILLRAHLITSVVDHSLIG